MMCKISILIFRNYRSDKMTDQPLAAQRNYRSRLPSVLRHQRRHLYRQQGKIVTAYLGFYVDFL